jgi:hypothetical protein
MKTESKAAPPLQSEKDFRAFLRKQGLLLKSMKLCDAWPAVLEFHRESVDKYSVLTPEGEGVTFDAHLGTADRGVRFEVAINRLFRLLPEDASAGRWPGVRLSLRLQYTLDMMGMKYLNRHQASAKSGSTHAGQGCHKPVIQKHLRMEYAVSLDSS